MKNLIPHLIRLMSTFTFAETLNPQQAYWRNQDGSLSPAPAERNLRADGGQIRPLPAAEGAPSFVLPFAVEANSVVSVALNLETIRTDVDAGAEG